MLIHDNAFDEVREAQIVFRRVLDAMSWPGKVVDLPTGSLRGLAPWPISLLQVARTLLDAQVRFSVHGINSDELARYLAVNTGAINAPSTGQVDFVFAGAPLEKLGLGALHPGHLLSPDDSATLVLACQFLQDPSQNPDSSSSDIASLPGGKARNISLTLRGRGVRGERTLVVDYSAGVVLLNLAAMEYEYPLGIDVVLTDEGGRVAGLPRTTRWQKEGVSWAM
jgi:alpha-D-ribose 1-methylphosphonate 5-triphosphate synthase subunit PhnH